MFEGFDDPSDDVGCFPGVDSNLALQLAAPIYINGIRIADQNPNDN